MQYIIMIAIVLGLALSDFATGIIKSYVKGSLSSSVMRRGGLNKLGEILVMSTVCGLEIGIKMLGSYYHSDLLADVTGAAAAISVFIYIAIMEVISIMENYVEINGDAKWAQSIIKHLKNINREDK